MKNILAFCFLLCLALSNAQNCKCEDELNFVVDYYEENLPGFIDNVNSNNLNEYRQFKDQLFSMSREYCSDEQQCFKTLLVYVEFFKDNHSSIYASNSQNIDENNPQAVKDFIDSDLFKNREIISSFKSPSSNSIEDIENIYQLEGGSYTVAVIKNKNAFRDYVGVIVDSKSELWQKGQVKFELKKVKEDTYDMFLYLRNHSLMYEKNIKLVDGILGDSWFNINLKSQNVFNSATFNQLTFKELNEDINYLYIPTFNGGQYAEIIDFYNQHDAKIKAKPYLIIDVRDNGGGSDACVYPLLNYIYTKPFTDDNVDVYATKENIRKSEDWYQEIKKDSINYSREYVEHLSGEIERMKAAPNKTFIPRTTGDTISLDKVLDNPKKVMIIANKNCASSCETLLFWALESDKTVIVGENSGGYVGYGEISNVITPNFNFYLGCTMTRYSYQRQYEVDGVPPQIYFNNEKDWIEQAVELIKK